MADVTFELTSVLEDVTSGVREVNLAADTLEAALAKLCSAHPNLRVHLFDESGAFREHVLCFHNEENTRWRNDLSTKLTDGDRIRIIQAVSGG